MPAVALKSERVDNETMSMNSSSDPHEEQNIGEMYNWVIGPVLKVVEEYKASW